MVGEGSDETAFGAVTVEANIERLREFEIPLREGTGVERVQDHEGGGMWVLIALHLLIVLFVGEQREGR